jgi:hypothetical protein
MADIEGAYVCRYRLMDMFRRYLRKQRVAALNKKIAETTQRIYRGEYSVDDDYWSEWDNRYGKYKWTKK